MLPIECVVRGYIAGSGWKEYRRPARSAGTRCPRDCRSRSKLPEPIFTPATKAQTGHDENITREQAAEPSARSGSREVERSLDPALPRRRPSTPGTRGIIIADTKFELGLDPDGNLVLGDEALTPDSSRFWPGDTYEPGRAQDSFDKQFVRDYCEKSAGTRRTRARSCRTRSCRGRARSTSKRSSG